MTKTNTTTTKGAFLDVANTAISLEPIRKAWNAYKADNEGVEEAKLVRRVAKREKSVPGKWTVGNAVFILGDEGSVSLRLAFKLDTLLHHGTQSASNTIKYLYEGQYRKAKNSEGVAYQEMRGKVKELSQQVKGMSKDDQGRAAIADEMKKAHAWLAKNRPNGVMLDHEGREVLDGNSGCSEVIRALHGTAWRSLSHYTLTMNDYHLELQAQKALAESLKVKRTRTMGKIRRAMMKAITGGELVSDYADTMEKAISLYRERMGQEMSARDKVKARNALVGQIIEERRKELEHLPSIAPMVREANDLRRKMESARNDGSLDDKYVDDVAVLDIDDVISASTTAMTEYVINWLGEEYTEAVEEYERAKAHTAKRREILQQAETAFNCAVSEETLLEYNRAQAKHKKALEKQKTARQAVQELTGREVPADVAGEAWKEGSRAARRAAQVQETNVAILRKSRYDEKGQLLEEQKVRYIRQYHGSVDAPVNVVKTDEDGTKTVLETYGERNAVNDIDNLIDGQVMEYVPAVVGEMLKMVFSNGVLGAGLTARERQVFKLMIKGHSYNAISSKLDIEYGNVKKVAHTASKKARQVLADCGFSTSQAVTDAIQANFRPTDETLVMETASGSLKIKARKA